MRVVLMGLHPRREHSGFRESRVVDQTWSRLAGQEPVRSNKKPCFRDTVKTATVVSLSSRTRSGNGGDAILKSIKTAFCSSEIGSVCGHPHENN
jgi:hypothetical protein